MLSPRPQAVDEKGDEKKPGRNEYDGSPRGGAEVVGENQSRDAGTDREHHRQRVVGAHAARQIARGGGR